MVGRGGGQGGPTNLQMGVGSARSQLSQNGWLSNAQAFALRAGRV